MDREGTIRRSELSDGDNAEISYRDESVMMLGSHAYGFSVYRQTGTAGDQHYDVTTRCLDVFVQSGDRWLVAFSVTTPMIGKPGEAII